MRKSLFALLSVLVVASMLLAACGGAAPAAAPAPAEQAATEATAEAAAATEEATAEATEAAAEATTEAAPAEAAAPSGDRVQILDAHSGDGCQLVGPACEAVWQSMGQRCRNEASVAAGGTGSRAVRIDDHHVPAWFLLFGQQGCPQTREARPDDQKVGVGTTNERLGRLGSSIGIKPERRLLGVGNCAARPWRSFACE